MPGIIEKHRDQTGDGSLRRPGRYHSALGFLGKGVKPLDRSLTTLLVQAERKLQETRLVWFVPAVGHRIIEKLASVSAQLGVLPNALGAARESPALRAAFERSRDVSQRG